MRVTADAARRVRAGHPWVFDRSVTHLNRTDGRAGEVAVVFDPARRFAGVGLYDPASPIRVRVLAHGEPTTIDDAWLAARLEDAVRRRAVLADDPATTAYRVAHGENDGLGGLVVDRYADVAVVKVDTAAWLPHLGVVRDLAPGLLGVADVVLRGSRRSGLGPARALVGRLPEAPVPYLENGLRFRADVVCGQKTGAFLDQRENRARVRDRAAGARVLDVFCCTGGFSVHAAAGGAVVVESVDAAPAALTTTAAAMADNAPEVPHRTVAGDAFEVLDRLARSRRRFDLVVVDPPSFANKAAAVPAALRAYARLAAAAVAVTEPGGLVVLASCSSRVSADAFEQAVLGAAGRALHIEERTGAPLDHPVGFPEGAYLHALFARRA